MSNEENTVTETQDTGTGINWTKVAVRDAHGAIDQAATLALVGEELAMAMENEVDMGEISAAVASVFGKLTQGGAAQKAMIDLAGLATRSLGLLGEVPFGAETRLQDRIKDFVRGESDAFVDSNGATGLYHIKRGKDGGVRLSTVKYVEEYRALQAKKAAASAK